MSNLNIRNALVENLINSAIVNITPQDIDVGENRRFKPAGKSYWLSAYYVPADSNPNGKDVSDSNIDTGFFQVNVNSKLNSYDKFNIEICDSVRSSFKNSQIVSHLDQEVEILDSVMGGGSVQNGWWRRIVTINYRSISVR